MGLKAHASEKRPGGHDGFPGEAAGRRPLPVEQVLRLRQQMPPMYLILTMNAAALAYTHHVSAPRWLSVELPVILIGACLIRLMHWLQPVDEGAVTLESARRSTGC